MREGDGLSGGDPPPDDGAIEDPTAKRRRRGAGLAQGVGNAMVAYEEIVLGRQPPGGEIREQIDRVHTLSAAQGLMIELPAEEDGSDEPEPTPR